MINRVKTLQAEKEAGFSLIEIIVTMVLMSIIFAVVVISSIQWRKTGIDRSVETDLKTNAMKVENWKIGNPRGVPSNDNINVEVTDSDTKIAIIGNKDGTYTLRGTNIHGKTSVKGMSYSSSTQRVANE